MMVAVCVTPVCATEVAVSVTLSAAEEGRGAAGGVYETESFCVFESVPQPVPEQFVPLNFQVTPAFVVSSPSAAVKFSGVVVPTSTEVPVAGGIISIVIVFAAPPPWHPLNNATPRQAIPKAAASLNRVTRPPQFVSFFLRRTKYGKKVHASGAILRHLPRSAHCLGTRLAVSWIHP